MRHAASGRANDTIATDITNGAASLLLVSNDIKRLMPDGLQAQPALDILLQLRVNEDKVACVRSDDIASIGFSPEVIRRWIAVLVDAGCIDRRGDLIALSASGDTIVTRVVEAVNARMRG